MLQNPSLLLSSDKINSVLLVRLRSIGDTVLMTPCLNMLKQWNPKVNIDVLMEETSAPVVQGHSLIRNTYILPSSGSTCAKFLSRCKMINKLRSHQYDIAVNMHGGNTGSWLTLLSGAYIKVTFVGDPGAHFMSITVPDAKQIWGKQQIHSVEKQLALLYWLGIPLPPFTSLSLELLPAAIISIKQRLSKLHINGDYVVMHATSRFPYKQWGAERWAQIVDNLWEQHHLPVIIIAAPSELNSVKDIIDNIKSPVLSLADLDLSETMVVIAHSRLFIGIDSGPSHIAASFQRPSVVMFGVNIPSSHWYPWSSAPWRILQAEAVAGISAYDGYLSTITVEEMIAAIEEVLKKQ